ncbi:methyltransferase domain-containing protein [Mariprofundus erugo]|uniref:Methyltransferase domain-containing protein n=1 Tax=Mariprofundus erugo TaxID=2528639 RepID=A0A5R9GFB8_9PROT|nr:methyltransferase domain-containing protein [Mariprofundus erugo]TLS65696.1 methyltransferase domain-containing protein [Mariprofundus erugo]TLS77989.1 methyltransferase domain-containing protein [Mariprofundus erugo]
MTHAFDFPTGPDMHNNAITEADNLLGQYIPLHYHFQMLEDEARMSGFKAALDYMVPTGGTVLDLGSGTGVLSFLAAQKAGRVYSVERQPELIECAKELLIENGCGDKVQLELADARDYLPPEPVDVVVCEMLHSALLREKQLEVIQTFKQHYREKFGDRLPLFIPDATILGVEPICADFSFQGYHAPISFFEDPGLLSGRYRSLGAVTPYCILEYQADFPTRLSYDGPLTMTESGRFNALRFVTKSLLAINLKTGDSIDWMNLNLVLPIKKPLDVSAGERFHVRFSYEAGGEIQSLKNSIEVARER